MLIKIKVLLGVGTFTFAIASHLFKEQDEPYRL